MAELMKAPAFRGAWEDLRRKVLALDMGNPHTTSLNAATEFVEVVLEARPD